MPIARGAPNRRASASSSCASANAVVAPVERGVGDGGLRAPVRRGGVRLVHHLLALPDLEHVGERGARVALREAQAGARIQEQRAGVAVADRAGLPMCVGGLERGLGGRELAALGERLHERGSRAEDHQPAGVPVGRERGLGVGDGVAERSGAKADVGAVREQRPDAVVGLLPTGVVDGRREDPVRIVEAVGQRQAAHREPDHDGQDRVGTHRGDRPLRQAPRRARPTRRPWSPRWRRPRAPARRRAHPPRRARVLAPRGGRSRDGTSGRSARCWPDEPRYAWPGRDPRRG